MQSRVIIQSVSRFVAVPPRSPRYEGWGSKCTRRDGSASAPLPSVNTSTCTEYSRVRARVIIHFQRVSDEQSPILHPSSVSDFRHWTLACNQVFVRGAVSSMGFKIHARNYRGIFDKGSRKGRSEKSSGSEKTLPQMTSNLRRKTVQSAPQIPTSAAQMKPICAADGAITLHHTVAAATEATSSAP